MPTSLKVRASELSFEERAEISYRLWKENGFSHSELLPAGASRCGSDPELFIERVSDLGLDSCKSKAERARFRKSLRSAQAEAKAICDECPLVHACLASAITIPALKENGDVIPGRVICESDLIYGGTTAKEREKIMNLMAEIWTEEWEDGKVLIPGLELESEAEEAEA